MVVQHNLQAMNANRLLGITTGAQGKSTEKLSSGYKINRAADDAAGLSISEKMRKQIRGLDRASTNAQDGVSSVQTAEGALTEVHDMLQRMNELATQAANGTNSDTDRQSIQNEIDQLTTEIDRVAETTKFNETYLLKGSSGTKTKINAAYDAGIKGTFVDNGGDKATLTVDLSVGKSVSVAGQTYNIVAKDGSQADGLDSTDSLSKLKDDIKNATGSVTINGTEYKKSGNKFDAGTGTTYTAEEVAGKLSDGSKVKIGNGNEVIARDYTNTATNKTAQEVSQIIEQALKQANRIGDTKGTGDAAAPTGDTLKKVSTLDSNPDAKATAKVAMLAYDATNKTTKNIAANDDITEYLKAGSTFKLYKSFAVGGGATGTLSDTATHNRDIIISHTDGELAGITKSYAANATLAGETGVTSAAANTLTMTANYTAWEAIDPVQDATLTDVTHKAYAEVDNDSTLTFEDIDTSDAEKAKNMVDGQNALLTALSGGKVHKSYTSATGDATYSHDQFADDNLDIRSNGEVYYGEDKIATLGNKTLAGKTIGAAVDVKTTGTPVQAVYEEVVEDNSIDYSKATFTITKGQTEVANDLKVNLHVGADADMTNKIGVDIAAMNTEGLGIKGLTVADDSGVAATYAVDAIENAIRTVSAQRSALGAVQNRLEHTINNLDNVVENTTSAESRIRDTDMAKEMVNYSKNNILAQAGQSMLAQANQANQGVLSLLG